ncbi:MULTISPECIES: hypothetical protein [unclassified Enterococcus]|uniref:hypothetical protein n=1 Tax=unclassified Enterococcus TaxID=2608891 RepID=UPI000B6A3726|nr:MULTISPECIES: hypothetical protein [unclassified Enterococcus]OTO73033.1 hypothetical protein A5865_001988 [Enterococcus sp. 12E11_DIV0728]OUZ13656.1 hypothetical protein A5868_002678 [Enterococcus sp. 12F9_DIV0723]
MKNLLRHGGQQKNHFHHKQSGKNQSKQQDSAIKSLMFKILSVFVIGFLTKKIRNRKK